MMQENLKKVFMRSVCALNFEAMSILDPAEQNFAQQRMQQELQKQVDAAMNPMMQVPQMPLGGYPNPDPAKSEISFNLSENGEQTAERDYRDEAKDFMHMGLNVNQPVHQAQPQQLDANTRKIESKDSMWKPAPIIGREMTMGSNEPELTTTQ
jgi:hypothetical protein